MNQLIKVCPIEKDNFNGLLTLAEQTPGNIFYIGCGIEETAFQFNKTIYVADEENSRMFNYTGKNITMVYINGINSFDSIRINTIMALSELSKGSIIAWNNSLNGKCKVPQYLHLHIDHIYQRYLFKNSQISYIIL